MPLSLKDPNYKARGPPAAICKSIFTFSLHLTILYVLSLSLSLFLALALAFSLWVALAAQVLQAGKDKDNTNHITKLYTLKSACNWLLKCARAKRLTRFW